MTTLIRGHSFPDSASELNSSTTVIPSSLSLTSFLTSTALTLVWPCCGDLAGSSLQLLMKWFLPPHRRHRLLFFLFSNVSFDTHCARFRSTWLSGGTWAFLVDGCQSISSATGPAWVGLVVVGAVGFRFSRYSRSNAANLEAKVCMDSIKALYSFGCAGM